MLLLLGAALLLDVATKDLAPPKKVAAGVRLDTADKSFSLATNDTDEHDAIVKALDHGIDGVRECWRSELTTHPKAHGTITYAFTILPDGSLSRAIAKADTVNDKTLGDCSTKALGKVVIPLSDKTIRVVAPLVFTNGTETATPAASPGATPEPEGEAAIDDVFGKARPSFDNCYAMAKEKDPRASGTVTVEFAVEENGSVREATIAGGSMSSMVMNQCTTRVLRGTKFLPPAGGRARFTRTMKFPK